MSRGLYFLEDKPVKMSHNPESNERISNGQGKQLSESVLLTSVEEYQALIGEEKQQRSKQALSNQGRIGKGQISCLC